MRSSPLPTPAAPSPCGSGDSLLFSSQAGVLLLGVQVSPGGVGSSVALHLLWFSGVDGGWFRRGLWCAGFDLAGGVAKEWWWSNQSMAFEAASFGILGLEALTGGSLAVEGSNLGLGQLGGFEFFEAASRWRSGVTFAVRFLLALGCDFSIFSIYSPFDDSISKRGRRIPG